MPSLQMMSPLENQLNGVYYNPEFYLSFYLHELRKI
jgi:hypothetical protein